MTLVLLRQTEGPARSSAVVEFFGLPGAGKTTLAAITRQRLAALGIASEIASRAMDPDVHGPVRVARKLWLSAAQGATRPVRTIRSVGAIAASQRVPSSVPARSVQWLVTQGLMARARRRGGLHLLEEGVLQAQWSIGLRGRSERLATLGRGLPASALPDLVVVVDAPIDVIGSRLDARGSRHSRTERLGDREREAELLRGNDLAADLIDRWSSAQGPDRVVRVVNGDDLPPELDAVVARIASLARSAEVASPQ